MILLVLVWKTPKLHESFETVDLQFVPLNKEHSLRIVNSYKETKWIGREPWSSGYGWPLMFVRSWVQIPAQYTGWTFFHIDLLSKLYQCLFEKKTKKTKRGRGWPIFIKKETKWMDIEMFIDRHLHCRVRTKSLWVSLRTSVTRLGYFESFLRQMFLQK